MDITDEKTGCSPSQSEQAHPNLRSELGNAHQSPVDLLPEELLLCVLEVLIEHNPMDIGPLLSVSRYWHQLANTTPSLWTRLLIRPTRSDDVTKHIQYVHLAIKNSGNLPLNITIDFGLLTHRHEPTNGIYGKGSSSEADQDEENVSRLLQLVAGVEGVVAARWRSFRMITKHGDPGSYTSDNTLGRFLKGLDYPTPLLESLSLHLYAADAYFSRKGGPLQDLYSLKHLILDAGGHLGYINFTPEKIQTLCFRLWGNTRVLARFTGLRTLSIANWANSGVVYDDDPMLCFPVLDCLTLQLCHPSGNVRGGGILLQKISAPLLTTLRLMDDEATISLAAADAFHHIHTLDLLSPSPRTTLAFITSHLYKYAAMNTLTVCPWNYEAVASELRGLRMRGLTPVGLDGLYTVISDNEGVELKEANAKSMLHSWKMADEYKYKRHCISTCVIQ